MEKLVGHFTNIIRKSSIPEYVDILDAFSKCFPAFSYEITDEINVLEIEIPVGLFKEEEYRRLFVSASICDLSPFVVAETERAYHTMCLSNPMTPFLKGGFFRDSEDTRE